MDRDPGLHDPVVALGLAVMLTLSEPKMTFLGLASATNACHEVHANNHAPGRIEPSRSSTRLRVLLPDPKT